MKPCKWRNKEITDKMVNLCFKKKEFPKTAAVIGELDCWYLACEYTVEQDERTVPITHYPRTEEGYLLSSEGIYSRWCIPDKYTISQCRRDTKKALAA